MMARGIRHHRPAAILSCSLLVFMLFWMGGAHADWAMLRDLPEGSFVVPETPPGGTPRLGRLDPAAAANVSFEAYKDRERDHYEGYRPGPPKPADDRDFLESWAGNRDLRGLMRDFFASTDARIAEVNRLIGEVEEAARICDRIEYDAALSRLMRAYVRASLHIQRNIDHIQSLVEAAQGAGGSAMPAALAAEDEVRRRWAHFWWGFLDVMASDGYARPAKEVWRRTDTAYRASILGEAYTRVWAATLSEIERRLANAEYPPFPENCGEEGEAATAAPLQEDDPALEAQREVLAGMEAEFAAMDENFRRIGEGFDSAVGEAPAVAAPVAVAAPAPSVSTLPQAPRLTPPNVEGVLPDPSTFKVPPVNLLAIDASAKGAAADLRADPCALDPRKVCSVLLSDFQDTCEKELEGFLDICRKGPSLTDCAARCDGNWQQGKHDIALGELAQAHIRAMSDSAGDSREKEAERLLAQIEENKRHMAEIKATAAKRVVSIYINENNDTIIRHHGKPIAPHPPLRLAGTAGGEPFLGERVMLADLEAANRAMDARIGIILDEAGSDWARMAMSKWRADPAVPDGRCTPQQNDENRTACLAACRGGAPGGTVNMCHGSFVPQLALPYGRPLLYPPGHPMHDPASAAR